MAEIQVISRAPPLIRSQSTRPYDPWDRLEIYSTLIVGASADMSMLLSTQAYTGVAPTGTITLYDGGTAITGLVPNITNAPPSNGGTASLTEQFFPTFTTSGKHVITAKYSGDAKLRARNEFLRHKYFRRLRDDAFDKCVVNKYHLRAEHHTERDDNESEQESPDDGTSTIFWVGIRIQ